MGFSFDRDLKQAGFHDLAKAIEGGVCPQCGKPSLSISRGVEVGHIFQLGTKYTEPMEMSYIDEKSDLHHPLMGCYGIGVGRLAAAVCESLHDEHGPIWPISSAPWQVHLCCVRADDGQVKAFADSLYAQLQAADMEVIYDDRLVSAGFMFADADLLGVPIRVIASPRNMKDDCCEIITRDKSFNQKVRRGDIVESLHALIRKLQN
jgi:prolyl-tRNA synthetase